MLAARVLDPGSRKNGLNGSIFTRPPVQREKHNIGITKVGGLDNPPGFRADHLKFVLGRRCRSDAARKQTLLLDVGQNSAKRINRNHSMPGLTQCFGYLSATGNRHITFRTIPTKKNGYFHNKKASIDSMIKPARDFPYQERNHKPNLYRNGSDGALDRNIDGRDFAVQRAAGAHQLSLKAMSNRHTHSSNATAALEQQLTQFLGFSLEISRFSLPGNGEDWITWH